VEKEVVVGGRERKQGGAVAGEYEETAPRLA